MLQTQLLLPGEGLREIPAEEVAGVLAGGKGHLWIDVSGEVQEHQAFLLETLGIHPLAVEDMLAHGMLPKVEEYDGGTFFMLQDIVLLEGNEEERLRTHDLYLFIGRNFLVTLHRGRIRAVDALHLDAAALTRLLGRGPEPLSHAILRRMVDSFFPMLDRIEARVDESEEAIFNMPEPRDLQRIFQLRKDVVRLRSLAQQQLTVMSRIAGGEFEAISEQGVYLARDLYDHLYRFSEKASGFREEILSLLDAYLSQTNNRMNDVVRVLTMMATILLPLSIVVGFYGMNFRTMPGLSHPYGWLLTLGGMAVLITVMLTIFKHKKWL